MRLLLTFLFALGVLTGTGGGLLAPKPATAPAPAQKSTASSRPEATPQPDACPRCNATARHADDKAEPKLAADAHPTPRPNGA